MSTELTIEIRAKPGKFQEPYQTLQALLPTIRNQKGCRDCRMYRDVEDGEVFSLFVQWEAQESLEKYLRSSTGGALLGAIDLLSEGGGQDQRECTVGGDRYPEEDEKENIAHPSRHSRR